MENTGYCESKSIRKRRNFKWKGVEREREIYKQRIKMYGRKRGYCKGVGLSLGFFGDRGEGN